MRVDVSRFVGRRSARIAGLLTGMSVLLALAIPASASAATEATATLAPIGTGSYLLTVTNTGSDEIMLFNFGGENLSNFASTPGINCGHASGTSFCAGPILPKASAQVCYSGPAVTEVSVDVTVAVQVTSAPAVASCPIAGFTPAPSGGAGTGGGGGSTGGGGATGGGNPTPAAACVVPALKGKKLTAAKAKLKAADCTLGKVKGKKTKSAKVSKQSPAAGKTLAAGAKVNVTVK